LVLWSCLQCPFILCEFSLSQIIPFWQLTIPPVRDGFILKNNVVGILCYLHWLVPAQTNKICLGL
jgi:hypothetical protein